MLACRPDTLLCVNTQVLLGARPMDPPSSPNTRWLTSPGFAPEAAVTSRVRVTSRGSLAGHPRASVPRAPWELGVGNWELGIIRILINQTPKLTVLRAVHEGQRKAVWAQSDALETVIPQQRPGRGARIERPREQLGFTVIRCPRGVQQAR